MFFFRISKGRSDMTPALVTQSNHSCYAVGGGGGRGEGASASVRVDDLISLVIGWRRRRWWPWLAGDDVNLRRRRRLLLLRRWRLRRLLQHADAARTWVGTFHASVCIDFCITGLCLLRILFFAFISYDSFLHDDSFLNDGGGWALRLSVTIKLRRHWLRAL